MIHAQILSHWTQADGDNVPHFPAMIDGDKWSDATGTAVPITPNGVILDCHISAATFAEIEADPDLFVLWDEPNPRPPNGMPAAAEFGLLRAFLARQRYSQQQINQAIGVNVGGRSRAAIADALRGWLRGR